MDELEQELKRAIAGDSPFVEVDFNWGPITVANVATMALKLRLHVVAVWVPVTTHRTHMLFRYDQEQDQ